MDPGFCLNGVLILGGVESKEKYLEGVPNLLAIRFGHWWWFRHFGQRDQLVIPISSIVEGGVRFPLHPLLRQVLNYYNLCPIQLLANFFRVVRGTVALNEILGTNLGLWDIHHLYTCSRTQNSTYYLKSRKGNRKLILNLPESAQGLDHDCLVVTGNFVPRDGQGRVVGYSISHKFCGLR